ncbi:CRISPR-associated protein Cas5 [Actinomadura sp. 9N407]|uniref:CRISPR-associated protein Cas5 n=1 Tax=Actinomadura sp. 9N407 TaxID=3375154 RepID=UPI003796172E
MTVQALELTVTAPVVSFRNPLYAGVQVGLPCPPPATVGGMLAAAAGGWAQVDPRMRFAMAFRARGQGVDLETYHPLEATGKKADPTPRERAFLADVRLTVWVLDDPAVWMQRMRRPRWPLRLGRSQDLVGLASLHLVRLQDTPGRQGGAVVPADLTSIGTLLRLPTAVSEDRGHTRWDAYRFAARHDADQPIGWSDGQGRAVVALPPTHPAGTRNRR